MNIRNFEKRQKYLSGTQDYRFHHKLAIVRYIPGKDGEY